MSNPPKVSVGLTTQVGYPVSLVGFLLAVYAYAQGDRSAGTAAVIVAGVAFAITQVFRYGQAIVLAKQTKQPSSPVVAGSSGGAAGNTLMYDFTTAPLPVADVPDTPASVAAEEADLPSDDVELQNVPRPESAATPVAPEGEPPGGVGETAPLQPGDTEG